MAPGALIPDAEQEFVTFHGLKGKVFRPVFKGDARVETFESIPHVDMTKMWSSSLDDRKSVAKQVVSAFREAGFIYALNHGISEDLQNRTRNVVKEFFDLPLEEKMKIHINNSPAIMGYEALLETRLDDSTRGGRSRFYIGNARLIGWPLLINSNADCKESVVTTDDPYDPACSCPADFDRSFYSAQGPINQWPNNPKNYREVMHEYRTAVLDFSMRFLRILALALDLEETHFDYITQFPMASLRALHYPPQEAPNDVGIDENEMFLE